MVDDARLPRPDATGARSLCPLADARPSKPRGVRKSLPHMGQSQGSAAAHRQIRGNAAAPPRFRPAAGLVTLAAVLLSYVRFDDLWIMLRAQARTGVAETCMVGEIFGEVPPSYGPIAA